MKIPYRPVCVGIAVTGPLLAFSASGQNATFKHARGAVPVDPARYDRFQSVERHRAWLEPAVDLSANFPPIGNQEWQPACTAWAIGYALRSFLLGEQVGHKPMQLQDQISPQYIYNRLRKDKADCRNEGVGMPETLDLLTKEGAVTLADMPYGEGTCTTVPNANLVANAAKWKINGWRAVQRETPGDWRTPIILDDVKGQLQAGLPVVFSMSLPDSFDKLAGPAVFNTNEAPGPEHAMVLVGYDEKRQAFRIMNSWGTDWGDHGYLWIGYPTFARLTGEAYVINPPAEEAPVKPADPPPSVDEQLTKMASGLECGNVKVTRGSGGRVAAGFTGARDGYDAAKAKAAELDPKLRWNVAYRPWPQCEAELTLANPLTRADAKVAVRRANGQVLPAEDAVLKEDDLFSIDLATTKALPFVNLIYLQADGSAVQLYHGELKADAGYKITVGAAGKREARFQVAPPLGNEVLIEVASDTPLFGDELGRYKTERQFLTLLRTKLADAVRAGHPVSASIQRLRTTP